MKQAGDKGTLWLIPVGLTPPGTLSAGDSSDQASVSQAFLSPYSTEAIAALRYFIVENAKSARAFLKPLVAPFPIQELKLAEIPKHAHSWPLSQENQALLEPLLAGHDMGLMSESGCPAVADPGALLVRGAHELGIRVKALIGPSSILLALMQGGLGGQQFRFNGYLPNQPGEREVALRKLEKDSQANRQTELWIETPYRNAAMIQSMQKTLRPHTRISLAINLASSDEQIISGTLASLQADLKLLLNKEAKLKASMIVFSLLA